MYLISLLHCTSYFRHSTVLAVVIYLLQNFLWDVLFKMSSSRRAVALQSGNILQTASGNCYAVWQAPAIHPHSSSKFGRPQNLSSGWTWESVAEIPELQRAMLPRLATSHMWAPWCKSGEFCEPKQHCNTSWVLRQNLTTCFFKKLLLVEVLMLLLSLQVGDFTFHLLSWPHFPSVFFSRKCWLNAWLQKLHAFLLVKSPRHSLWDPQLELSTWLFSLLRAGTESGHYRIFEVNMAFERGNRKTTILVLHTLNWNCVISVKTFLFFLEPSV